MESYDIEKIFKEHKEKVYRLAWSISRNDKDSEDILQNTFLKVIKNINDFRKQSKVSTWVYRIAYNEALMHLRKRYRNFKLSDNINNHMKTFPGGIFVNWSKLPDEQLLDNEFKERLNSAIASIPIKYRMPLLLHNIEGLPVKDAALILGIKIGSLKTRLHRAYLMIKSEISGYLKDRKEIIKAQDNRCGIWTKFLYDYSAGNLEKQRELSFQRHINDCVSCKSFIDLYSKAVRIAGFLECKDLPPELEGKISSFLEKKSETFYPYQASKYG